MELNHLRALVAVADQHSFTRAAQSMYLSQPAITQLIHALETELKVPLFDRLPRAVQLTSDGELLYRYAKQILGLLDESQSALADRRSGERGRVVLGAGSTISIFVLPEIIRSFRSEHPEINLSILTGKTHEIRDHVLANRVDLGLVTSPVHHRALTVVPLYDDEMILVVAPECPLPTSLALRDLAGYPLVLFAPGSGFRAYLDEIFETHGLIPRIAMESDSMEAIKRMAAVDLGAAIIPRVAAEPELSAGTLRELTVEGLPLMRRRTAVIFRRERYQSRVVSDFLCHLEKCFHQET